MMRHMTASEISSFVHRLLRHELTKEELSSLTTADLGEINAYLAEYAKVYAKAIESAPAPEPRRTYTEEEILAELGLLSA